MRYRQQTWGELEASIERSIEYLEGVVVRVPYRRHELDNERDRLNYLREKRRELGKTKKSAFWKWPE